MVPLLYHKSNHPFIEIYHHLNILFLFLPLTAYSTPLEYQGTMLEVTSRCQNVISWYHSAIIAQCYQIKIVMYGDGVMTEFYVNDTGLHLVQAISW